MSYHHLTQQERYVIGPLSVARFGIRKIGGRLGRHHSTVSRELKKAKETYLIAIYWHDWTQPLARTRGCRPRHFKRQVNSRLVTYVETRSAVELRNF